MHGQWCWASYGYYGYYPIIWWYLQTGHFIVYSYGKERFDFSNPHLVGDHHKRNFKVVYDVLGGKLSPKEAVLQLFSRDPKAE